MTIKEAEELTGLARSNIRFYEKEKLIAPSRNESNGYRDYSEKDVGDIRKIAYLRTLGISIEDIRAVIAGETSLREIIGKQQQILEDQIFDLTKAKMICARMLESEEMNYEELQIEQYLTDVEDYWQENRKIFKSDSVSFLQMWGSLFTWGVITVLCLLTAILSYSSLPPEIPVQWSGGDAVSAMSRRFIFLYPAACVFIRFLVKHSIRVSLRMGQPYRDIVTDYLTNFLCFVMLSAQVFTILFVHGGLKHITVVLLLDTAVFIGMLIAGIAKTDAREK